MYKLIRYEVEDGILVITLSQPDKLNAFSEGMCNELIDAFEKADNDDEVRAIIVTGEGKGFCAGQDISSGGGTFDYQGSDIETYEAYGGKLALRIHSSLKPVIAAINGAAIGIGITMTLPMDIRIASADAKMGFVFAAIGITPEACSSWFLPRLVGIQQALEWGLSAKIFNADEALKGGLISRVFKPEELMAAAKAIAKEYAANAPVSMALTRQLFWNMLTVDSPRKAQAVESKLLFWSGQQKDANEGISALLEKRKPQFTMRPSRDMPEVYPWWEK